MTCVVFKTSRLKAYYLLSFLQQEFMLIVTSISEYPLQCTLINERTICIVEPDSFQRSMVFVVK